MEFTIITADRRDKKALWVAIPDPHEDRTTPYNIWDLPPRLANNEDVKKAIAHAFELGALAQLNLSKRALSREHVKVEFR